VLEEDVDPERLVGLAVERLAVGDEDPAVVVVRRGVAPEALGEPAEELGHEDAPERRAVADHHAVGLHDDGLLPLEQQGVADGAVVVEDGAGEEVRVGGLHDLGAERGAHGAPVGADEPRVVLRHKALGGRHHGERVPAGVRDAGERLPGLGHPDLGPAHHHRLHRLVEEVRRRLHGVLEVRLVAQPGGDEQGHRIPAEGRVGEAGQVAADADVHGLALPQRRRDGGVDLLVRVVQVVDDGLVAGDGLEAAELLGEVREADGVVQDAVGAVVVGVGTAHDADHGEVLAVRAGDGVEHAEPADGERDGAGADATGAGVPVGGVPGVELVAAADEAQPRLGDEVVEQGEVEVAGDGEHVGGADLHEPPRQVPAESGARRGRRRRRRRRADDGVGVGHGQSADAVAHRLRHAVGGVADQEGLHGT